MTGSPQPLVGEVISPAQWKDREQQAKPKTAEEEINDDIGPEAAAIAIAICDRMASEAEPVAKIAAEVMGLDTDDRSGLHKLYRWRYRSAALARLYARAREARADVIADEIIDIVDKEPDPHKARARMDARKWVAGKFNRGMYGDDVQVTGHVEHNVNHGGEVLATIEQRLAKRAKRLAEVGGGGVRAENEGGDGYTPSLIPASHTKAP